MADQPDIEAVAQKSSKSPAFQFYPADFLNADAVEEMTFTEIGVYVVMLCKDWLGKGLPADLDSVALRISSGKHHITSTRLKKLWDGPLSRCFDQKGDRLFNPRLEAERSKQRAFSRRQTDNGSLGGRPPKKPKENPLETQAFSVSKPRVRDETEKRRDEEVSEKKVKGKTPPMDEWWLEFLRLYPEERRRSSALVNGFFVSALLDASDGPVKAWERMRANLIANKSSYEWEVKRMIPGAEKYLVEGRWENVLPKDAPTAPASKLPSWATEAN